MKPIIPPVPLTLVIIPIKPVPVPPVVVKAAGAPAVPVYPVPKAVALVSGTGTLPIAILTVNPEETLGPTEVGTILVRVVPIAAPTSVSYTHLTLPTKRIV